MGRIGVRPEEIGALAAKIAALPGIEIEGMFSHFAMADCRDKAYTKMQLAKFQQAIAGSERAGDCPAYLSYCRVGCNPGDSGGSLSIWCGRGSSSMACGRRHEVSIRLAAARS
jgi:hypothetical protein